MSKPKRTRLTIRFPKEEMEVLRAAADREMVPVNALVRHNLSRAGERWALGKPRVGKGASNPPEFVNATIHMSNTERDDLVTEARKQMISITALIRRRLFQPEAA